MKKRIFLLLLICTLVFAASCGDSSDTSYYVSGDSASAGNVPFAVEEPSEAGVSEITEDSVAFYSHGMAE